MCRKRHRSGFCVPAGEGTSLWAEVGGSAGKALQGDVEEVSPHILHSLLLLFIFLAACQTAARQHLPSSSSGYLSCQSNPPPHLYFPLQPPTPTPPSPPFLFSPSFIPSPPPRLPSCLTSFPASFLSFFVLLFLAHYR